MKIFISLIICAYVSTIGTTSIKPNYITDEEFETAQKNPLTVTVNSTSGPLKLPPLDKPNLHNARPGFGPRLWENAIVPYTLDPKFTNDQRAQVALAINAYQANTCIQFKPKSASDKSWVDILYDANVCGVAQLCMNTGAQFAKFGGSCVSAGVMTHELGHTLCMGHEQSRRDRDKWIAFNASICQAPAIDGVSFNRGLTKLYDYVSIEHYEGECYNGCFKPKQPGVTKCGSGGPLSVLDIEIINEMYGCTKGCLGYRFVNMNNSPINLVRGGYEVDGTPLYVCRSYHQGDIIPGKYNLNTGVCYVPYGGGEQFKNADVEVLTNSNGAKLSWIPLTLSSPVPSNAIRGGRTHERETLYIIQCLKNISPGKSIWIPGKYQPSSGAYIGYNGAEIKCTANVKILVCDN